MVKYPRIYTSLLSNLFFYMPRQYGLEQHIKNGVLPSQEMYRLMAMTIIRAYRTVSTNAALFISRLMPIDLRAR